MSLMNTNTTTDTYNTQMLIMMLHSGALNDTHPMQRRSGMWSNEYRDGFIVSVIRGEDCDSIKICEQVFPDGSKTLWLIDGMQRLSTIQEFRNNMFKLGKKIERPIVTYTSYIKADGSDGAVKQEQKQFDLRGKKFEDLPEELKQDFDMYSFTTVKQLNCNDDDISYHIRRYNHQQRMNPNQMGLTYASDLAPEIREMTATNTFFTDATGYSKKNRTGGVLEMIVMYSLMALFHLDDFQKKANVGSYLNENSSEEEVEYLNGLLERLAKVIDGNYDRYFNAKDSFLFITLFDYFNQMGIGDDNAFAEFLDSLDTDLAEIEYHDMNYETFKTDRDTSNKQSVIRKLHYLEYVMSVFFKKDVTALDMNYDEVSFVAEMTDIAPATVNDNLEDYADDLESLMELHIKDGSRLTDARNMPSLLALVAYAYDKEVTLDKWLEDYSAKTPMFLSDQKENYRVMLSDLNEYLLSNAA